MVSIKKRLKRLNCKLRGGHIPGEMKEGRPVYCRDCGSFIGTVPYRGNK